MSMRRIVPIIAGAALVSAASLATSSPARADAPSPIPTQSAPLDLGSKTSGIGIGAVPPVAQPAPPPVVDVRSADAPSGAGPDTPGKTGLGNTDRGPVGGAATGPGTQPKTGAPVGVGTPAASPGPR